MGSKPQTEQEKALAAVGYITSFNAKEDEALSVPQNFNVDRELIRQLTPSRPVQGNLFTLLGDETYTDKEGKSHLLAEHARKLEEQGRLLSTITDGINAGVTGQKTILYIARELYRQAQVCGGFEGLAKYAEEKGLPVTYQNFNGKRVYNPYVRLTLSEAAKWIKGSNQTKNRQDIADILSKLDKCINFWRSSDGKEHLRLRVLSIEATYTNERTKQTEYLLQLRPIFLAGINGNFITASESTSRLLPSLKKEIEMNLYLYLLEQLSYKNVKGYPVIRRSKDKVDARVVPPHYEAQRKRTRLKKDFEDAIEKLKKEGLLNDFKQELGSDGFTIYYIFTLNPQWTDTTKETPKQAQ